MLEVGDRIGDHQIVARLKAGGMATLFLAQRKGAAGFQRFVAIKVVHAHLASDRTFVNMFLDEGRLSSRIIHPNVVHVEDLGEAEGTYFLVMEYVHGCSLALLQRSLAKRRRMLAPDVAVSVIMKVADGLHAAHETRGDKGELLGVVHRDISPQNVLLAYQGHVKLIDFGIAKARGRSQETEAGSIKGKFRYMSPEQAWGKEVDRRSDVFALGIVLWELLAGKPLFDAQNDVLVLDKVRHPVVEPPSTYAPNIPPALDAVVLSALAESVDDRPASAADFRRKLAEAYPQAMLVDEDRLADLMVFAMADQMERDRTSLPESVVLRLEGFTRLSGRTPAPGAKDPTSGVTQVATTVREKPDDEVLQTMTLEAADIHPEDFDVDVADEEASPEPVARSVKLERARDKKGMSALAVVGVALAAVVLLAALVAGIVGLGGGGDHDAGARRTHAATTPPARETPPPVLAHEPTPPVPPAVPVLPVLPDAGAAATTAQVDTTPPTPPVTATHAGDAHAHHGHHGHGPTGPGTGPVLMQDDF